MLISCFCKYEGEAAAGSRRGTTISGHMKRRSRDVLGPLTSVSCLQHALSSFVWHHGLLHHMTFKQRSPLPPLLPISLLSAKEAETLRAVTFSRSPDSLAAEVGLIFWVFLDLWLDIRPCTWCFHKLYAALGALFSSLSVTKTAGLVYRCLQDNLHGFPGNPEEKPNLHNNCTCASSAHCPFYCS